MNDDEMKPHKKLDTFLAILVWLILAVGFFLFMRFAIMNAPKGGFG